MIAARRYLKWRYRKLGRRAIRLACSRLFRNGDPDPRKTIFVAGTGRSGTTWLADIIASQIPCRLMFEPFHSRQVEAYQSFNYFQYMRPSDEDEELRAYCHAVLTGNIRHRWIDRHVERVFPRYRLVKDIRANLFLSWLHDRYPEVPLLFIMRHPCAVVLSRMQLAWWTDRDIKPFLSQSKLIDDFLADKIEVIERARRVEEKHAIVWCISNLVPITQFHSNGLNLIFYENLCTQPEQEILKVFRAIRHGYDDAALASVNRPSTTAVRASAVVTGEDKVRRWTRELSAKQTRNILSVVEDFGLDHIYGDSVTPLVTAPEVTQGRANPYEQ